MTLADNQRLFQNLTVKHLYVDAADGHRLQFLLRERIDDGRLQRMYHLLRGFFLEEALYTHEYGVLGGHVLSKFLAILEVVLANESLHDPVDVLAHIALGKDFIPFGKLHRHEHALQDVKLVMGHRTISAR